MQGAASEAANDIADANRANLRKGKRKDGSAVSPRYKSLKYKGRLSPVDLYRSGAFHKTIRTTATKREVITGSDHTVKGFDLAGFLEVKYSGNSSIYGVQNLRRILLPGFQKQLRREMQK